MHTRSGNGFQGKSLRSYPIRDALSVYIYISTCLTRDPTLIEVPLTAFPADPPVSIWEHFLPRIVSLVADDGILWDGIRVGGMDRETGVFQILTDRERLLMVTGWRVSFCVF